MRQIATKLMPFPLSKEQKENCVSMSVDLEERPEQAQNSF
jgi:hypothetical protein